jgi:hypothetical protein
MSRKQIIECIDRLHQMINLDLAFDVFVQYDYDDGSGCSEGEMPIITGKQSFSGVRVVPGFIEKDMRKLDMRVFEYVFDLLDQDWRTIAIFFNVCEYKKIDCLQTGNIEDLISEDKLPFFIDYLIEEFLCC